MPGLDVLISVANLIYLFSYSVRDILWLRILTIIGATLLLPFYYLQEEPLWAAIAWNLVFIAINIFWVAKLLLERRPVDFSPEEERIYQQALRHLGEHQARHLLHLGEWRSVPQGTVLFEQGETVESLLLIVEGSVDADIDGENVDSVGGGRFVGATAFLSGDTDYAAPVRVVASEPTRIITWDIKALEATAAQDPELAIGLEACLGLELSHLLQTSRTELLQARMA